MDYRQTLDWLYTQLPMYQRQGASAYKADLRNTELLMELLDHPEKKFTSVHVGGTNGKGSVSHSLAASLQSAGYKTGLYTSPHLKDFRERIRIDGKMIPEREVVAFVTKHKADFENIGLSFFEMTVGMAFAYFAREKVDLAIVEVGMGGRLDSTNVLLPELSIITNISLDHTQFLGNTLPAIAREKAGIIKANVPVLIGERYPETTAVFKAKAEELGAPLYFAEDLHPKPDPAVLSLKGAHQRKNLSTILAALDLLEKQGYQANKTALSSVSELTGLRGRWELLQQEPRIICDTGHNEAAVRYLVGQLQQESYARLHMVWGMVNDKDLTPVLKLLPPEALYYWCAPGIPRAMSVTELQAAASEIGLDGTAYPDVQSALKAALDNALPEDLIFIGGSTFVVADAL